MRLLALIALFVVVASPAAASTQGSRLRLGVDASHAGALCGMSARRLGPVDPYRATIVNRSRFAVSMRAAGRPRLLAPGGRAVLSGVFGRLGERLRVTCSALDAQAVLANAIVRPLVSALAPASPDDPAALAAFARGFDW